MEKVNFLKNHRYSQALKRMKVPLYIHLEVTTMCTVGCPQCYVNSTYKGAELDFWIM